MTVLDDLAALAAAEAALNAGFAAQSTANSASLAAALRATVAPRKFVFVDEAGGSDNNSGLTPATAVKTLAAAAALGNAGQVLGIGLLSDVHVSAQINITLPLLQIFSANADGSAALTATKTLILAAPPATDPVWNGSLNVQQGVLVLSTVNIRLTGAWPAKTSGLLFGSLAGMVWSLGSLTIDVAGPFIQTAAPMTAHFYNASLPGNYPGNLFAGVAAGVNPNGYIYRTNITSA